MLELMSPCAGLLNLIRKVARLDFEKLELVHAVNSLNATTLETPPPPAEDLQPVHVHGPKLIFCANQINT